VLGLVDILLFEEPGVGAPKQRRAHPLAEGVSNLIARDGGQEAPDQDHREAQGPLGGEQTCREKQRISRQEKPHEQARLGEDDEKEPDRAEGDEELTGIEEHWHRVSAQRFKL
jgi:hypothetical protein